MKGKSLSGMTVLKQYSKEEWEKIARKQSKKHQFQETEKLPKVTEKKKVRKAEMSKSCLLPPHPVCLFFIDI